MLVLGVIKYSNKIAVLETKGEAPENMLYQHLPEFIITLTRTKYVHSVIVHSLSPPLLRTQ